MHHVIFLSFFLIAFSHYYDHLTCDDYNRAYVAIDNLINVNPLAIAGFVRLAFHDCVGQGCNGCLNFRDTNNNGLEQWASPLNRLYYNDHFDSVMSRADFWQLAAQVALIRGGSNRDCTNGCKFLYHQFLWGREDCETSPYSHVPDDTGDAHGDYEEVYRVLHGNFKMTDKEIVAAMGGHTLGGAFPNASGFTLPWSTNFITFDNEYFIDMLTLKYAHFDTLSSLPDLSNVHESEQRERAQYAFTRMQFVDTSITPIPLMMFNVDMALWKDLKSEYANGRFTGEVSCPMKGQKRRVELAENVVGNHFSCKNNKLTARYVEEFAHDIEAFYNTFQVSWHKLSTNGDHHLFKPGSKHHQCGNCIPVGGLCTVGVEKAGQCCPGSSCTNSQCSAN